MAFIVTDSATKELKRLLDGTEHQSEQVIRLFADPKGKLRFVLDIERAGDQRIQHQGATVMVVEPALQQRLAAHTLEFLADQDGGAWTLRRSAST